MLVEKTAAAFDPSVLSPLGATQAIEEWAAIEKVACAQKLRAATHAENLGVDADGVVAQSSGLPAGAARKQTKTARKAKGRTKTKFERGELSATQAGAIAEAAEVNPAAEADLLALAERATTNELLDACARAKREAMSDADLAQRQRAARRFRSWKDGLGMFCFAGALEPLVGAKLLAELERRADRLFREQWRATGTADTVEQRMADALVSLLESSGATKGPRTVVRLIVTKAAAERGWTEPDEKCETADGTQVPMSAVDDALCDADTLVQEVVVDEVDVQSIKTMRKYIPKRIRDALEAQGMRCCVCGSTKGLQIDHTWERRDGGPTTKRNTHWLCRRCHTLKTRRLYVLWFDPDGTMHWEPAHARAPS
jgi:hypothetical protein